MLLTYTMGDGTQKSLRLKTISHAQPITIGRGKDADIPLEDSKASRIHCAVRYWDGIFVMRDMNSSNGTLLNGEKVEVVKLNSGDVIKIGNTEIKVTSEGTKSDVTVVSRPERSDDEGPAAADGEDVGQGHGNNATSEPGL